MTHCHRWFLACLIAVGVTACGFAEKLKVGFDRSVDFTKYKTYTWAKPDRPITRPLLYQNVVATIDDELKQKGLERVEANGDITLILGGGIGFGYNMPAAITLNNAYWYGDTNDPILMAPQIAEGTIVLEFVDRAENKMVWRGTAKEKLDPENKDKSLGRIQKSIANLIKNYPPKGGK